MHLREGEYGKAHTDFFEAFKNYDESGSPRQELLNSYWWWKDGWFDEK